MTEPVVPHPPEADRRLSDSDVAAIVRQLRKEVVEEFYSEIGRGVWAMAQRVFIMALVAVAAYGFFKK
jgi:hypothetical protein